MCSRTGRSPEEQATGAAWAIMRNKANLWAGRPAREDGLRQTKPIPPTACHAKQSQFPCRLPGIGGGRAKQSQFAGRLVSRNLWLGKELGERSMEDGSAKTKPISPSGRMVCMAHPTGPGVRNKANRQGRSMRDDGCAKQSQLAAPGYVQSSIILINHPSPELPLAGGRRMW